MIEVKLCENNFGDGTEDLVKPLEQMENITVTVESCLGYCGDCASGPYALVNDELIQADSADELFDMIRDHANNASIKKEEGHSAKKAF